MKIINIIFILLLASIVQAQVQVENVTAAQALLEKLEGAGVEISNFQVRGDLRQTATFTDEAGILGVRSGLVMATGDVSYVGEPNGPFKEDFLNVSTTYNSLLTDPLLDNLYPDLSYFDAIIIEFDIVPKGNSLSFNYVMASEEYIESSEDYPDFFAFWFSGPGIDGELNLANIPGTEIPVNTSTVNDVTNKEYYNDNGSGDSPLINSLFGYDGYTDLFTAETVVVPCETYHLVMAIADADDFEKDAAVFIEQGSLSSGIDPVINVTYESRLDTIYEGCADAQVSVELNNPLPSSLKLIATYGGSASEKDFENLVDTVVIPSFSSIQSYELISLKDSLGEELENLTISLAPLCDLGFQIDQVTIPIKDQMDRIISDFNYCNKDTVEMSMFNERYDSLIFEPTELLSCLDCPNPLVYLIGRDVIQYHFVDKETGCDFTDTFRIKTFEPYVEYSLDTNLNYTVLDIFGTIDQSNMTRFEWHFQNVDDSNFSQIVYGDSVVFQSGVLNENQTCISIELKTYLDSLGCSSLFDTVYCTTQKFIIPNIISPNDDGKNDFFVIEGLASGFWALSLMNRYGKEVYNQELYDFSFNASGLSDGTYYYLLQNKNQDRTFKGWLQIVR